MIQVWLYNEDNIFIESTFVDELQDGMTTVPLLIGYVKPTFNGIDWFEGATQEEIDTWHESNKPVSPQPSEHELLTKETHSNVETSSFDNLINMDMLLMIDQKLTAIMKHLNI